MKKRIINNIYSYKQVFKFFFVGIIATIIHASVYLIALRGANIEEQFANFIGFISAFTVSYIGQRHWTFSHVSIENEHKAKLKFFLSSLFSLVLNSLWVYLFHNIFYLPKDSAVLGIVFLTPIITFFVLKYWVFPEK